MNPTQTSHAAVLLVAAAFATTAGATHYYVAPGGTGDYTQGSPGGSPLEAAQRATASGDVIHLATGLYEYESGDERYKLLLTETDRDILMHLVEEKPIVDGTRSKLLDNYKLVQN